MSWKTRKKAQMVGSRKISKRDRAQRKEIGRLTELLNKDQIYFSAAMNDLVAAQKSLNALATALDTRAHRALSWLRRLVRIKPEIPDGLLRSLKAAASTP